MNNLKEKLFIKIGANVADFINEKDASKKYRALISKMGWGSRDAMCCKIIRQNGDVVGHISYNGRVWDDINIDPKSSYGGGTLVYCPSWKKAA